MERLQSELRRLYAAATSAEEAPAALIDPANRVRALVLELTRPANWAELGRVWQGVQAELELPAPAIAVSGSDGLQLWFSLAEPVAVSAGQQLLASLAARFLPAVATRRLRLWPAAEASALRPERQERQEWQKQQERHARWVPAEQADGSGNWSAFVAPDLAPVFADTPWLDIPPSEEGQTNLLRGLKSITPAGFEAACRQLALPDAAAVPAPLPPVDKPVGMDPPVLSPPVAATTSVPPPAAVSGAGMDTATAGDDSRRFLLQVMNDDTVALELRIRAAEALLRSDGGGRH